MIRKEAIIAILGSPVAYYAAFAKVLGGVEAGIFASQFFYWYGKGHDPEGWVYKTQAEIEDETGLTRRNQETARKKLREFGVLEEKYAGMPAKLYYRLNLGILFGMMNDWFIDQNPTALDTHRIPGLSTGENHQDGGSRQPRMRESANQGCTDPPTKDVQIRQPRMRESAIHESANPPHKDGGIRHTNTKTTTITTTESTPKTTTTTEPPENTTQAQPVDVAVAVSDTDVPQWILDEFTLLLGPTRTVNETDRVALIALSMYPDHVIMQSFDAARQWLRKPGKEPIHSLARWLGGTAKRKLEAEQSRGNTATVAGDEQVWYREQQRTSGADDVRDPPDHETVPLTPEEELWSTVLQELALQLPSATYELWVRGTRLLSIDNDEYVIGLPNAQGKDWLENRLANMLRRLLASMVGRPVTIRFQVL